MHVEHHAAGFLRALFLIVVPLIARAASLGSDVTELKHRLDDPNPQARAGAILALTKLGDKSAAPAIAPLLKDRYPNVQAAAAEALGKLGGKVALTALKAALEDLTGPVGPGFRYYPTGRPDGPATFGQGVVAAVARLEPAVIQPFVTALRSPWADVRASALQHLQKRKWTPDNDVDKAYCLVAQRKFSDAANLGPAAIEAIVTPAGDGRNASRKEAARTLVQMGSKSFDPTVALLKHKRPAARIAAAHVLGEIGDPRAIDPLIAAASDCEAGIATAVAQALTRMDWAPTGPTQKAWKHVLAGRWDKAAAAGRPAVRPLVATITMYSDHDRSQAIAALVKIGDKKAAELLLRTVRSKEAWARRPAVKAMARLGGPTAVRALIAVLSDDSAGLRAIAAEGLGDAGDKRALGPLAKALKDGDGHVRHAAAIALATMGDARGVSELLFAAEREGYGPRPASAALAKLGKAAVPQLIAALQSEDPTDAAGAVRRLGDLGDRRAVKPLMAKLSGDRDQVSYVADVLRALGKLADPKAAPLLGRLLVEARHYPLPEVTAKALARLGPAGQKHLVAALKHSRVDVRKAAAQALKNTRWKPADQAERAVHLVALGSWRQAAALGAEAVPALLAAMRGDEPEGAMGALAKIGKPAVTPLIAALADQGAQTRARAAAVLGKIKDKRAVAPLRKILGKDTTRYWEREAAKKALEQIGPASLDDCAKALKSPDEAVREEAAKALGHMPDKEVVTLLIPALKDKSVIVRMYAAHGLQAHPDPRAVPALIEALKSKSGIRTGAARALGAIGAPAVKPLLEAIQTGDADARCAATLGLGLTRDKRAIPHLVQALSDPSGRVASSAEGALRMRFEWKPANDVERAFALMAVSHYEPAFKVGKAALEPGIASLKKDSADSRRRAATGLGHLGDRRAVLPLVALLKDPVPRVQQAAVTALTQLSDKRACAPMATLLTASSASLADAAAEAVAALWDEKAYATVAVVLASRSEPARVRAIRILGKTKSKRAVESLVAILEGSYWDVPAGSAARTAAADALGNLGDARAIDPLQAALKDKHRAVREAAAAALARLKSKG